MQKYDDVGSLPLPEGVDKRKFSKALSDQKDWAMEICRESMQMKIEKGIEVSCYPQPRNMVDQFMELIKNPEIIEEPYLIKTENAILPELIT